MKVRCAPLPGEFTLLAVDSQNQTVTSQTVLVNLMRIVLSHMSRSWRRIRCIANRVPNAADLVVGQEKCLIKALIVAVALFDIAQMPLGVEGCGIAGIGEHVGRGNLFS